MNRLFLLLFGVVTIVAHAQVPDYVPTEGLVAWYAFNGNTNDESGNGNDLSSEDVIYVQNHQGVAENAIGFPTISSQCEVNLSTSLQEFDAYSFSFWFRIDDPWSYNTFAAFTYGGTQYSGTSQMAAFWWDENWYWGGCESSGNGYRSRVRSNGISYHFEDCESFETISQWRHIVMTFEDDTLRVYSGGDGLIAAISTPLPSTEFVGNTLRVGTHLNAPQSSNAQREVDNLGIWNRPLSESEALQILNLDPPIPGCTDPTACNFDAEASSDDGSCIPSGCTEPLACNYNDLAECPGEVCDYTCCPGPGCCADGTSWDYGLGQCVPDDVDDTTVNSCPHDLDFDGVVGVGDLMDLLSVFGTDCPTNFTCGDLMNYHGYDYATVQIGEQCWFAENLKTEQYRNGTEIPEAANLDEWFVGSGIHCAFDFNDEISAERGLLYNGHAVNDERKLCPTGWHVPSDEDFMDLEGFLGMSESDIQSFNWRGTNEGTKLRTADPSYGGYIGTDEFGFNGVPAGALFSEFAYLNYSLHLWSSTPSSQSNNFYRAVDASPGGIFRASHGASDGHSVRCIMD